MSIATPIPTVSDKGRRALRTAVQVALAFVSLAAFVPAITPLFGAPHSSNLAEYAAAAGGWITLVAGVIAWLMSLPAVDRILTVLGVGSVPASRVQVVLREIAAEVEAVLPEVAPLIEVVEPAAAPVIEKVEDIAAALSTAQPAPLAPLAPPVVPGL